jgi:aminoglycoside phosphotransferase (APT) family kinase protein
MISAFSATGASVGGTHGASDGPVASYAPYQLDVSTIAGYLADRQVIAAQPARAEILPGGISNDVLLVCQGSRRLVVKQALSRLRVAEDWPASPARVLTEAAALECAGSIAPGAVPRLIAVIPEDFIVVMEACPANLRSWKQELLQARVSSASAATAGRLLGTWHAGTAHDAEILARFEHPEAFVELRIDPYHRAVAARHPDLAPRIEELVARLLSARRSMVHGDFSPKNMLCDSGPTMVVLDWEVAHIGDPVFDLAFLLCHLRCKAARLPAARGKYRAAADAFLGAYHRAADSALGPIDETDLAVQTACLLLARVDGKSPVEYLDSGQRQECRHLARGLLREKEPNLDGLWQA